MWDLTIPLYKVSIPTTALFFIPAFIPLHLLVMFPKVLLSVITLAFLSQSSQAAAITSREDATREVYVSTPWLTLVNIRAHSVTHCRSKRGKPCQNSVLLGTINVLCKLVIISLSDVQYIWLTSGLPYSLAHHEGKATYVCSTGYDGIGTFASHEYSPAIPS